MYLSGFAAASFPTTVGAYQTGFGGGSSDLFVVRFGDPALGVTPSAPTVPPKGTQTFVGSGGSGSFTYSLETNASGGSINASTGAYTAGATGSVSDVVDVTDSDGNVITATVTVGPGVLITPASPSTPPKGAIGFGASGGSGTGFKWSLATNNSGGSINTSTGAYTAGATGSTSDTVAVVDSLGNTASTVVTVGANLVVSPAAPTSPPLGPIAFTTTGGSNTGIVWALATNNSAGTINTSSGAYTAGATGNVTDTVQATDSLGNVATTNVTIGPGASITPASSSTPPKGPIAFTANGGSGTGWAWSVSTNNSGATINASTGAYTAGAISSVSDVVSVVDSLGNAATANVTVGAGVSITPPSATVVPNGVVDFSASGGSGSGYAWSLATNASGGTIGASSGTYTAGATGNVTDTVQVADTLGNVATASVSVTSSPPPDAGAQDASVTNDAASESGTTNDAAANDAGSGGGDNGGCGCETIARPSAASWWPGGFIAAALVLRRRRRTRGSHPT
jgi:hypothetical protein